MLDGRSLNHALAGQLDKVGAADRGLLRQLCYGTLRDAPRLQPLLDSLLDKPLRKKDRDLRGLLLSLAPAGMSCTQGGVVGNGVVQAIGQGGALSQVG